MVRSVIIGTGSCIPEVRVENQAFEKTQFYERGGRRLDMGDTSVIEKFLSITGISERRYAKDEQKASDLAHISAERAIESAKIDRETLDYIILAHNFGDVAHGTNRVNIVPSIASRVKASLGIQNPDCVAYDLAFGCPGWLEGLIQANYYIRSGDARRCLVIGAETLSRVVDPHDRDTMIFSDGSGAVIVEAAQDTQKGIASHKTRTYAAHHFNLLNMEPAYSPEAVGSNDLFLKMNGRKVYEFALQYVPSVIKEALDKSGFSLRSIDKVLIHQANDKMDVAILERLFRLYGEDHIPEHIMPMTVGWLGNSSVATIPTLLDLVLRGEMENHTLDEGDRVVMASVGAGMNINALTYQF